MPSNQPFRNKASGISLSDIRARCRSTIITANLEDQPANPAQELERCLNLVSFSVLLKMDHLAAELQASSKPRLTDGQFDQIVAIKSQIKLCSDIGLFSIKQYRARQ